MDVLEDERGVSTVVGAILVFAILIIALSIYHAQVVPAENEKVELRHYQNVQGDLQEVRNAIRSVDEGDSPRSVRVQLGTAYPSRVFAVQPPGAGGRLSTGTIGSGRIEIWGGSGPVEEGAVCGFGPPTTTKSIVYTPHYNYLGGTPPIYYENSVLYRMTGDGAVILESGQTLVSGSTIHVMPLLGNLSRGGTGSTVVDFYGDATGSTLVDGPLTVTIPTRLSDETWERLLNDSTSRVEEVTMNTSRPSAVDIVLESGTYRVACTPVGVGTHPNVNPTVHTDQNDTGGDINPSGQGAIILENESRDDNVVTITLNNTGSSDVRIQRARINFYQDVKAEGGNKPSNGNGSGGGNTDQKVPHYAILQNPDGEETVELPFGRGYRSLDPEIEVPGQTASRPSLAFKDSDEDDAKIDSSDWFVLSLDYSDGSTATYFVQVPK
ncbi:MAG: hypothetical protein ABEJ58_02785 [Halodesulfurarchaeum sp.]